MKILFVEDDERISRLAKEVFIKTSHDVVMSPGVTDTIRVLTIESFDLVILDMVFLDGTGEDVLKYMVGNKIHTPVLIHSGYSQKFSSVIEYYTELGLIQGIYEKPSLFTKDILSRINSMV